MKCLLVGILLLLAFGLASSDKLDRTYLPPPGARFAGGSPDELQTPLEYGKQTNARITQNGQLAPYPENTFDNGIMKSTAPTDYSTSTYLNDFGQKNFFPTSEDYSVSTTSSPEVNLYDRFALMPNSGYLPSKQPAGQQSYNAPTSNRLLDTSNIYPNINIGDSGIDPGYYYYVPALNKYGKNIAPNDVSYNNGLNANFKPYSNQVNDGYITGKNQVYTPRIATTDEIAQNYQPSAFGYYGGNPMMMTSQNFLQQMLENKEITSRFGEYKNNLPKISANQNKQSSNSKTSVQPFQTPLVRTNVLKTYKSNSLKTSDSLPNYTKQLYSPRTTTSSITNDNSPIGVNQRNNVSTRVSFRPERPSAESDRNAIILNYENVITPKEFAYSFDTSNGIHADENGTATNGVKAKGSYSYIGDDGKVYSITYTADENGFQPRGDHMPTPPPVPEAIKRVIEQAVKKKASGIIEDGSYDENKYGYMNYQGAMDRYRPFKNKNNLNVSKRLGNTISRPSGISNKQNKENISDKDTTDTFNYNKVPVTNDVKTDYDLRGNKRPEKSKNEQIYATTRKVVKPSIRDQLDSLNQQPAEPTKLNQSKEIIFNQGQVPNQDKSSDVSINNHNEITRKEIPAPNLFSQFQNRSTNYDIQDINTGYFNNIRGKPNQVRKDQPDYTNGVSVTGNGYHYVPPLINFNPLPQLDKKNAYIPNVKNDTITSKRINLDSNLIETANNKETVLNQAQVNKNILTATDFTTRKPYISGPNNNDKNDYYDESQTKFEIENNGNEANEMYNDQNLSSYYMSTTTPMPSQTIQYGTQWTNEYPNQFYQTTTINPSDLQQSLPNVVEKRVNIPFGRPGVSVSQDVVTTTYKPVSFRDGVLEVNQNVKIYGIGKYDPTIDNFSNKVLTQSDKFYTTATVPTDEESRLIGSYPDKLPGSPVEENTSPGVKFSNEFIATGRPVFDANIPTSTVPINGPYSYPDIEREPKEEPYDFVNNPISTLNDLSYSGLNPGQELLKINSTQSQNPTKGIIGENFSGPKQPQRFDPLTGYYYK